MTELEPLVVTITADTRRFDEAMRKAARAVLGIAPVLWRVKLAGQRDRSRLVTRRKQRRSW